MLRSNGLPVETPPVFLPSLLVPQPEGGATTLYVELHSQARLIFGHGRLYVLGHVIMTQGGFDAIGDFLRRAGWPRTHHIGFVRDPRDGTPK